MSFFVLDFVSCNPINDVVTLYTLLENCVTKLNCVGNIQEFDLMLQIKAMFVAIISNCIYKHGSISCCWQHSSMSYYSSVAS
jgi:hypothetical protein